MAQMPLYQDETTTLEDLHKIRKLNVCAVCDGLLNVFLDPSGKAFVACWDWLRTHHEGFERHLIPYELNIETRREIMEQEYGPEKTEVLAKYISTVAITKAIATAIVESLWKDAPAIEKTKAILLCLTYQLNPLMKHLYLIGYKQRDGQGNYIVDDNSQYIKDWSIQIGIGATRLMAQRKHNYSYLDLTPRKATQEEIDKILGDTADPDSIYGFVHIKDIDTGAEAFGLRGCSRKEKIKGEEKGNTHLNQACIRAERLTLDRQYPGEMPQGLDLVDEQYIDAPYSISEGDEKNGEPPAEEHLGEGKGDKTILSSPKVTKSQKTGAAAARDPNAIQSFGELYQACQDDFHLDRQGVWSELNVNSQEEITDLPSECYKKIASVRVK